MNEREWEREQRLAEAVRTACLEAVRTAYTDASVRGLCAEGAWECAVGALQTLDVEAVLEQVDERGRDA